MRLGRPSSRLSTILLAAGMSRRMGASNKLLLDIDGEPLVRRTAKRLISYGMEEIVVVLGFQSDKVSPVLNDLPIELVVNQDFQSGQMTSVHAGLSALSKNTDGIMIFLSDLLLITEQDIAGIHQHFDNSDNEIVVPQYDGHRGNPIIFSPTQRNAIINGEKNLGCRKLISKNPDQVNAFPSPNDHVLCDIDTPESIAPMAARLGITITNKAQLQQTA